MISIFSFSSAALVQHKMLQFHKKRLKNSAMSTFSSLFFPYRGNAYGVIRWATALGLDSLLAAEWLEDGRHIGHEL